MFTFGAVSTKGGIVLFTSSMDYISDVNALLVEEVLEGKNAKKIAYQLDGRRTIQWLVDGDLIYMVTFSSKCLLFERLMGERVGRF